MHRFNHFLHLRLVRHLILAVLAFVPCVLFAAPAFHAYFPENRQIVSGTDETYLIVSADTSRIVSAELQYNVSPSASLEVTPGTFRRDVAVTVRSLLRDDLRVSKISATLIGRSAAGTPPTLTLEVKRERERDPQTLWTSRTFEKWYSRVVQDSTLTRVDLIVNAEKVQRIDLRAKKHRHHFGNILVYRVVLHQGDNSFALKGYSADGRMVDTQEWSLYWTPATGQQVRIPAGYVVEEFHARGALEPCVECHSFSTEKRTSVAGNRVVSSCYPCHQWITERSRVHGLVAVWWCTECHGFENPMKNVTSIQSGSTINEDCYRCHVDVEKEIRQASVIHGPVAGGNCILCHDPHGSEQKALTREATTTLCVSCHTDRYLLNHPVPGHPMASVQDPLDASRPFNCISCHAPHASNNQALFYQATTTFGLCKECHPQ